MKQRTAFIGMIIVAAIIVGALFISGTANAMPVINLYITDPPHYDDDVSNINITFTKIELQSAGENGTWITLSGDTTTIDLLALVNSSEKLGSFKVPAGNYTQIRFMASNASAKIGEAIVVLDIPSGSQTGLKVHFENMLVLTAGSYVNMTIDIRADNLGIHNGKLIPSMHAIITP